MSFLLLHGAGLGRWIWDDVLPHLQAPARALDLPGRGDGSDPGAVTLEQCVEFVTGEVQAMKAKPVLVGHSLSGPIALAVAARVPASVASVVLIAAPVPVSGKSFMSTVPLPARWFLTVLMKFSRHGIRIPASQVRKGYCNDLDDAKTALVLERVTPEAPHLYLDSVDWAGLPATMPRLYVKLLDDKSVPLKDQERFIERVGATAVESLPSGHLPMLSKPEELASVLKSTRASGHT